MWSKVRHNFLSRGCSAFVALGVGLLAAGSLMVVSYIVGGVAVIVGVGIFIYNWGHPTDDIVLSVSENAKKCKLLWGFWHTGEGAKKVFQLGTIKRVLLLEPNEQSTSLQHLLSQIKATKRDLIENIRLTTDSATANGIPVRWHNDPTVLSFTICDPSPTVEGNDTVHFSKKAFVVVQVADCNLVSADWTVYKKSNSKDPYAFDAYVKWFKDVWDNKSKEGIARKGDEIG